MVDMVEVVDVATSIVLITKTHIICNVAIKIILC